MTSAAARGASDAACARRSISAMVALAWVWVCSEMSRAAWASASQISCWRLAVAAPVCCHSSRSAAAMPASDPVQASRRASSRATRSLCRATAAGRLGGGID